MINAADAPKELRGAAIALKMVERDLRNKINRETKAELDPVWKNEVESRISSARDARIFKTGTRIAGGNPPVAYSMTSKRKMRGGLVPVDQGRAFEFGGNRNAVRTVEGRSPKGKRYTYKRHTQKQLPPTYAGGRIVTPAIKAVLPRMASLWAQTVVKSILDAAEGKS